jgi:signal transduction histidine kinase
MGEFLALLAHDLRNPVAALGANIGFVKESLSADIKSDTDDVAEALVDAESAVGDLVLSLDHLSAIARWIHDEPAAHARDGDLAPSLRSVLTSHPQVAAPPELPEANVRIKGANVLPRVLDILVRDSKQHAPGRPIVMSIVVNDATIIIELRDSGRAVAPELRPLYYSVEGQQKTRSRPDGRYGKALSLVAARALSDAMGAELSNDGVDGAAIARITLIRV